MRWLVLVGVLGLGGCGGDGAPEKKDRVGETVEPVEVAEEPEEDEAAPAEAQRQQRLQALRVEIRELRELIAGETARYEALLKRQAGEISALGDLSALRARERNFFTECKSARNQIEYCERKRGPVDPDVEALAKEAEALGDRLDKLEDELSEAQYAAARVVLQADLVESPVALDLAAIRGVRDQWLERTRGLRAGKPSSRKRRELNLGFRQWLGTGRRSLRVAQAALALDEDARHKGGTSLDRYDFSSYEFFVLCQMLEDDLDRRNVAVERDRMAEMRARIDALVVRVDGVVEERAALENRPLWDKVVESSVYRNKLHLLQVTLESRSGALGEVRRRLAPARELKERHDRERSELEAALEQAKARRVRASLEFERLGAAGATR